MGRCLHSNRTPKGGSGGHARRWRWRTALVLKTPHSPPCAAVCTRCRHDSLRSGALSAMIPCFRLEPSQRAAERFRAARGSGGRGRPWVLGAAGTRHKRPQQVAAGRAGRRDESGKSVRARSVTERQEINFQVPDAVFDKSWALGFRLGPPDVPPMPDCDPTFPSGLRLEAHVGSLPAKPAVCYYYKWRKTGGGQGPFP